jgi:3-hydroxymyristoyl/3-hydroxydecanoyl-(acyl carrier protein) dehydratase
VSRETLDLVRVAVSPEAAHFTTSIPEGLRFFEGHFEGSPILPGVAEVLLLVERPAREAWPDRGGARRLSRVKFERAIRPGDALDVHLERTTGDEGTRVRFRIERAGQPCASGTITFAPHGEPKA